MVYKASTLMKESDKQLKIKDSRQQAEIILKDDVNWCRGHMNSGRKFDRIWEAAKKSANDSKYLKKYCVRKYVVDEGLIDTQTYNVILNPNNVSTEGYDCQQSTKNFTDKMKSKFEDDFRKGYTDSRAPLGKVNKIAECASRKYDDKNFSGIVMSVLVLGELNDVTTEQKNNERTKFIKFERELEKDLFNCFLSNFDFDDILGDGW